MCTFTQKKRNSGRAKPARSARNHHRLPGQRSLREIVAESSISIGARFIPMLRTHFPLHFTGFFTHESIRIAVNTARKDKTPKPPVRFSHRACSRVPPRRSEEHT